MTPSIHWLTDHSPITYRDPPSLSLAQFTLSSLYLVFVIRTHHYLGWYGTTVCKRPSTAYPLYIQTFDEEGDDGDSDDDDGDHGDSFVLLGLVPRVDGEVSHHTCDLRQSTGSHWKFRLWHKCIFLEFLTEHFRFISNSSLELSCHIDCWMLLMDKLMKLDEADPFDQREWIHLKICQHPCPSSWRRYTCNKHFDGRWRGSDKSYHVVHFRVFWCFQDVWYYHW